MNVFEKVVPGTRLAATRRGDTLWSVALRELGDAQRWHELIWINGLKPPYLTDDPNSVTAHVQLTGTSLRIPDAAPALTVTATEVFGIDLDLTKGHLHLLDGDLKTLAGVPNLVQALRHAINTEIGEVRFHPDYGCGVHRLLGAQATPDTLQLARALVYRAVGADARIDQVLSATADLSGDSLTVDLSAMTVTGETIHVSN